MARGKKRSRAFETFKGTGGLHVPDDQQRQRLNSARLLIFEGFMNGDDNKAADGHLLARKTLDEIGISPWYELSKGERSNFWRWTNGKKPRPTNHHAPATGSGDDPGEAAGE